MKFTGPIFWILLFALALRLWGIWYALPQFFINDERANVYGALKMLELRTLVPAWHEEEFKRVLNYLPLPSYLYLVTLTPVIGIGYLFSGQDLASYRAALTLNPTTVFLAARITIALMGVATLYLTYLLAKRLFSSHRAGLLAALFLALSFYHVQLSQVTRQWMPSLLFLSLAWLMASRIYRGNSWKAYALGGLFAGLGAGANTAAAVAMIPLTFAHFLRPGAGLRRRLLLAPRLWLAIGVFLAVSLLSVALYPYGLTQGEAAGTGSLLGGKLAHLADKSLSGWLAFLGYYARLLIIYETILCLAAVGGVFLALRTHRRWLLIAAAFVFGYLALLYLFFNIIPRGALFMLPILAVFAGYAADGALLWLQQRIPPTRIAFYFLFSIFFFLLFAWPLAVILRYDYLLAKTDTRILAAEWLYRETPRDAKILADLPYLRLANTKAGVRRLADISPAGLRVEDRTLLGLEEARYPQPNREVLNLHFVPPDSPYRQAAGKRFFTRQGYRYFIVEYEYADRIDLEPHSRTLAVQGRLRARFAPWRGPFGRSLDISGEIATVPPWRLWELERFGQIVEIYEL